MENREPFYISSIDYNNAFESQHIDFLSKNLESYGILAKPITKIAGLYKNVYKKVYNKEERLSSWFEIKTSMKQECILSPLLLGMAIDLIMKKCNL